jgi:branched-subunit amino acid transport protein AzlD
MSARLPDILLAILAMGAVTLACRAAPFLLFGKRKPPALLDYAQRYLPPMIMVVLVFNSYKSLNLSSAPWGLPALVSGLVVALLQAWKGNALLSIVGGTALYMAITRLT